MSNLIIEPLMYEFIQRGLIAAVIVGITCGVIGCYVVLKSLAFMGDALAHAILPGVAIAYLLSVNLLLGALVAAFLVALG
ncbi:MAG: manganese ABC transporter permease, partial [Anaerolineaceae bacterium]|nr:manganese ABC transporter permease [Anaerolineaceae bacterium]